MDLVYRGSQTAKNGFKNEDEIIFKFNNWKIDKDAKQWLIIMRYNLEEIKFVKAVKIIGIKFLILFAKYKHKIHKIYYI